MAPELTALLESAWRDEVTLVTSFARLERGADGHVAPRWTVMVRSGGVIRAMGMAETQEEALYEALEALRLLRAGA